MEEDKKKKLFWRIPVQKDNFLILILLGVLLLVIALPVKKEEQKTTLQSEQTDSKEGIMGLHSETASLTDHTQFSEEEEFYAYTAYLEKSLEELLATVEGVGKVRVMVTLENSGEAVVEKDKSITRKGSTEVDSAGGSRNTTDLSDAEETIYDGSSLPYVSKVISPKVKGVVVSAQGGGDGRVDQNITEAIQALFGIEAHKIKIVKMNSQ